MKKLYINNQVKRYLKMSEFIGPPRMCPCGNITHLNREYPSRGYTIYCSDACSKKYRSENKSFNIVMSDYDWLYHQRINLKKSKDQIAKDLGCSHVAVNKWLKYHNIPKVKYNESNTDVLLKLRDKDFLYNIHTIQKKSCEEIAELIGSSKATVSLWIKKHGIEPNNINDYPRERGTSKECFEIVNYIRSIYDGEVQLEVCGLLGSGLSLDILIPEFNLAIEYNGLYSHIYRPEETTYAKIKDSTYHLNKTTLCESNGIQLLHIFSSLWKEKPNIWKSMIANKLNKTPNKIYARNCIVKECSVNEKNNFLDENHLQGKDRSNIKLGLYFENELVGVMTFIKARYSKTYYWELSRFAIKTYTNVIGGFSKLLAYFRSKYTENIISYADRTYSQGKLYENNNFKKLHVTPPGYYYVLKGHEVLINRRSLQKKQLLKKLNRPELTEFELATELNYNKIFDCGMLVYGLD